MKLSKKSKKTMKNKMKIKMFFSGLYVFSVLNLFAAGQPKIIEVRPTPYFPKVKSGEMLKQIAQVRVQNPDASRALQLEIAMDGFGRDVMDFGIVESGEQEFDILIPDIDKARNISFKLLDKKGSTLDQIKMTWQPQKKWKVYYAAVSHQDMGFISYYQNLRRANREGGIEIALEFCKETDSWEEDAQFRWNVETSEPLIRWMSKQTPEKIKEFERRIQEGRIGIAAIHNTISSQMAGYEVLARSFYTPNRYVIDKLDIEPAKVAVIDDVTGITRSWPLYSKEAQIPYLMHGSNHPNCLNDLFDLPVFYWKSPDGDSINRTLCRTDSYYSPNKVRSWDRKGISYLIDRHVDLNWEYDCILAYDSHDFADPTLDNAKNIREWNAKYAYPKIRCSLIQSFFDDIAQQVVPANVFETTKDAPDSWDDQDATDADLSGKARRVNYEIPSTEKFASIAMSLFGGYPEKDIFQAYNRTVMYHEHTNGAVDGGNHKYYETERIMHQSLIDEAVEYNKKALNKSLEKIGLQIKTKSNSMVIYNPLNWERDEIVYFMPEDLPFEDFVIVDKETSKTVEVQKLTNGKLAFFAKGIPALGYKTYGIKKAKKTGYIASKACSDKFLENEYYKLKIDNDKNIISDLIDKQLEKNLIDKSSPYALGEYIHYDHYTKEWKKTEFTNIECFRGNLLDEIHISQKAYLCGKVELVVYLHHTTKKIDFELEVDKLSNGEELVGSWVRYLKEASFCAIPVNVPDYQHYHELAGAVTQPGNKELQFEASESAYYAIQHFADASNDEFGVTLSTIECPLVEYGFPRPAYWDSGAGKPKENIKKPENSNMFLYLMNNFFSTNIRVDQPGNKKFTFSINSHNGNWRKGKAYKFGWESSHPIISQIIAKNKDGVLEDKRSFLTVDKDNVICSTLKLAESNGSGFILRFFELEGKKSNVKMKLGLNQKISKAYAVSLIENDLEELTVNDNNEVEFEINGHGIKTIRVLSNPTVIASIQNVEAVAISNAELKLNWMSDNSTEVSHFNVYRSFDAECKANSMNFIGIAEGNTYLDETELNFGGWGHNRLDENTNYYYRVQAVDKFNNQGKVSEVIKCTTLATSVADALPVKVQGVYTVHVSPLAPENYINVWFYTNFEKDVDKYMIHRGETESFTPGASNRINTLIPSKDSILFSKKYSKSELNRQMYADSTAEANKAYYYKVCAVDNNGQKGEYSDPAFAYMKVEPVSISSKTNEYKGFKDFNPKATVSIDCTVPGCELYYSTEDPMVIKSAEKYNGEIEINESTIFNVAGYKSGDKDPLFRYRRLIVVSHALSQSQYGGSYSAAMAIDGARYNQWVSKQYGGKTKAYPADVWLGVNLPAGTEIRGILLAGDNRDMMPVQKDFKVFLKQNETLIEVKDFVVKADSLVKNTYEVDFREDIIADGIMIYFDKDHLPKSELPEQDGLVRISELMVITPDGEKAVIEKLFK